MTNLLATAQLATQLFDQHVNLSQSVLIMCTGILDKSHISEELRTTEELLHAEKKQFENIRNDKVLSSHTQLQFCFHLTTACLISTSIV